MKTTSMIHVKGRGCGRDQTMTIRFSPADSSHCEPYVFLDFGVSNVEMTVREFIHEWTPVMLEAFEFAGGPFAL